MEDELEPELAPELDAEDELELVPKLDAEDELELELVAELEFELELAAELDVEDELELAAELVELVEFMEFPMLFKTGVGDAIVNKGVELCFVELSIEELFFLIFESNVFFMFSNVRTYSGCTTELSDLFILFTIVLEVEFVITIFDILGYYFFTWFFATNEISLAPGIPKFFSVCSHFPYPLY